MVEGFWKESFLPPSFCWTVFCSWHGLRAVRETMTCCQFNHKTTKSLVFHAAQDSWHSSKFQRGWSVLGVKKHEMHPCTLYSRWPPWADGDLQAAGALRQPLVVRRPQEAAWQQNWQSWVAFSSCLQRLNESLGSFSSRRRAGKISNRPTRNRLLLWDHLILIHFLLKHIFSLLRRRLCASLVFWTWRLRRMTKGQRATSGPDKLFKAQSLQASREHSCEFPLQGQRCSDRVQPTRRRFHRF